VDSFVAAEDLSNLRQGDVIDLEWICLPLSPKGRCEVLPTPAGAVLLSQTCDIVQPSKTRCLVAPVIPDPESEVVTSARKGRKPLHLYMGSQSASPTECVADLECAVSIPKASVVGARLIARYSDDAAPLASRRIAARIARAFGRFPFPDEVHPVFKKLRSHAQSKAGTSSNLGTVLGLIDNIRVRADQWVAPGRRLKVWVIVPEELLPSAEDHTGTRSWQTAHVESLKPGERPESVSFDRLCELIIANRSSEALALARLWSAFGDVLRSAYLLPDQHGEVVEVTVEVLSDREFTYQDYRESESLDLEVLSG
jgi:hypothetical protein